MGRIILITGGARSGKSAFALTLAERDYHNRVFVATAPPIDDEMRLRIARHQAERGDRYTTIEEPFELADTLAALPEGTEVAVVDCLTVWLGNQFHRHDCNGAKVDAEISKLLEGLPRTRSDLVLVTNEVGWGIIPENAVGRAFRDSAGRLNAMTAGLADRVVLCCCGIPTDIKSLDSSGSR